MEDGNLTMEPLAGVGTCLKKTFPRSAQRFHDIIPGRSEKFVSLKVAIHWKTHKRKLMVLEK